MLNCRFKFEERSQYFIRTHNETLIVPGEIPAPAIAVWPAAAPAEQVTLNRDYEVSQGPQKGVIIPKGSKLEVFSRGAKTIGVRFRNETVLIPKTVTVESK